MIHHKTIHAASMFFEIRTGDTARDVLVIERICETASKYSYDFPELNLSTSEGGPCFGPSIIIKGEDELQVLKLAKRIESYIKRFKGVTFD